MATPPQVTHRIGRAALGGSTLTRNQRPSGGIAIPGYDAATYWSSNTVTPAIGQGAIGGRVQTPLPSAGLLAGPDADSATVTVSLWWAYADAVTLVRVDDATGERTPVRASPVLLDRYLSRRNSSSNPRVRDALTGYSAGNANSTLSRLTGLTTPIPGVATAARVTGTSSGSVSLRVDVDPTGTAPMTYSWLVRTSAVATTLGLSVEWFDVEAQAVGTQFYPVTSSVRTAAGVGWSWATVVIDTSPNTAAIGVASYLATGMPAGGTMDVTARLAELTAGEYFDGDRLGGAWAGTPGLSPSDLAPISVVVDAEAPLDTPVRYELTSGAVPGFVARSEIVTLPAGNLHYSPRQCLITHPGLDRTIHAWVERAPTLTKGIDQTAFRVRGRTRKVIVSEDGRSGDEGSLVFIAETFDERDRLLDLLEDGSPLLLRFPADYGYPPLWWLSFGDLDENPWRGDAPHQIRKITAPFTEVDRPAYVAPVATV